MIVDMEALITLLDPAACPWVALLLVIGFLLCHVAVERLCFLGDGARGVLLPGANARRAAAAGSVETALGQYLRHGTREARVELVARCLEHRNPHTLFLRRTLGSAEPVPEQALALHARAEEARGLAELARGVPALSALTKAATVFGLLGAVSGLGGYLRVRDAIDHAAGMEAARAHFVAAAVAAAFAAVGWAAAAWCRRRGGYYAEMLVLARRRIVGAARDPANGGAP